MPPTLSYADYAVIAFYFAFMTLMSWVFKRFIKNTSDYFRGGGEMLWWMAGAGAFMVSFSAVTFTGMAGKAYEDGPVVLVIFVGNALGFLINYFWFAPVSRQTRAVTAMQVVRNRFGKASEQFFTWLQIPVGTFYAGIWLYGLCVFVSAAFDWNQDFTIVITGLVVLVMALVGGSWSVMAGDFVQMLILMPVTIVAAVLAVNEVGGAGEFFDRLPSKFYHWGEAGSLNFVTLWVVATLLQKLVSTNSMQDCSRYLSVKDSKHARWAALLGFGLFIIGPAVWFIPPMAARILHPEIGAMFPKLKNAEEAAYFATAITTMPSGMVGLLLSGIFGATMSSMDGGLNKNAGFFVKNFYQPYVHPTASEKELLVTSKFTTFVLGLAIIGCGLLLGHWKDLKIFEWMTYFSGIVALPVTVPLVLGLFVRRTPGWSGWATVAAGLVVSVLTQQFLTAHWVGEVIGRPLNKREASDWVFLASSFVNIGFCTVFFLATSLLYRTTPAAERQRIDEFFTMLKKPVDFHAEENSAGSDNAQAKIMGLLCLIYGAFILLLAFIPNPLMGRVAFLFCGGTVAGIGGLLYLAGTRGTRRKEAMPRASVAAPAGDVLAATAERNGR